MPDGLSIQYAGTTFVPLTSSRSLGFLQVVRLVAECHRFLDQRLLFSRVLLEVGLQAQEQPFEGERFDEFSLEGERLVDRLDSLCHKLALLRLGQRRVTTRFVPVVRGDGLIGVRVVWLR